MEGVHFYALEGRELELELHRLRPAFVVLYDQSPAAIRELEVYSASALLCPEARQDRLLRIYMLFYAESLEQQKFCAAVDRERKVFKSLIQQKAVMMCPISEDGKAVVERPQGGLGDPLGTAVPLLPFGSGSTANNAITRNAGGLLARAKKRAGEVVVDMREFGSSLPGVLHAHGFRVSPCTLEVGDYVLSPEICVERKSIPDLIQSFTTGRLYTQAQAMAKHYKYPVLLIEFSGDKAFALQVGDALHSQSFEGRSRCVLCFLALLETLTPPLSTLRARSGRGRLVLRRGHLPARSRLQAGTSGHPRPKAEGDLVAVHPGHRGRLRAAQVEPGGALARDRPADRNSRGPPPEERRGVQRGGPGRPQEAAGCDGRKLQAAGEGRGDPEWGGCHVGGRAQEGNEQRQGRQGPLQPAELALRWSPEHQLRVAVSKV